MPARRFVLGSRGSSLALCQARIVQALLEERFPRHGFAVEIIQAEADEKAELPLGSIAGEGIFVKALQAALKQRRIDLAVHSLKDMPLDEPPELCIAAVMERGEPRDAFVSPKAESVDALPPKARVGTSSLRRRAQLLARRGDLTVADIRGNVDTRLRKLDEGGYDAVIVAACGLIRLGLEQRIAEYLHLSWMLPEPGQGALVVEARKDDTEALQLAAALEHGESRFCTEAERSFLRGLGGGCRLPIAAYASLSGGHLGLEGAVIAPDGHRHIRGGMGGPVEEASAIGRQLAAQLASQGALQLLTDLRP